MTLNVRGLTSNLNNFKNLITKHNHIDIFCLQETKLTNGIDFNGFKCYYGNNKEKSQGGTAILVKNEILITNVNIIHDRLIYAQFRFNLSIYFIINVYLPNNLNDKHNNIKELISLLEYIEKSIPNSHIIICGDFNTHLSDKLINTKNNDQKGSDMLTNLINRFDLFDVWTYNHYNDKGFTFFNGSQKTRIDYFFISSELSEDSNIQILDRFSDHNPLTLSLNNNKEKKYTSWKLNLSILNNEKFINETFKLILKAPTKDEDLILWWDKFKIKIKKLAIHFCSLEKKEKLKLENNLVYQLNNFQKNKKNLEENQKSIKNYFTPKDLNMNTSYINNIQQVNQKIEKLKEEIKEIDSINNMGAFIRSRSKFILEQPTKFFYGLEKMNIKKKKITFIYDSKNTLVEDNPNIIKVFEDHFTKAFNNSTISCKCNKSLLNNELCYHCTYFNFFTKNLDRPTLNPNDNDPLLKDFTIEEIEIAVNKLNNNSSPGPDGLPNEFYKKFSYFIIPIMSRIFNFMIKTKSKPDSFREGVTTLLPKKDEPLNPSDFRPITMNNADSKIFSKLLVIRTKKILNLFIDEDQTGLPNRNIQEAIKFIINSFHFLNDKLIKAILILLDFEKAYDNMDHSYMLKTLAFFGFNSKFISIIDKLILENNYTTLLINNSISKKIYFKNGVKQGCPFSPILFASTIELIAVKIRNTINLRSIIGHKKQKLYLDDITLILKADSDILILKKILDDFKQISNMKINWNKSILIPFNLSQDRLLEIKNCLNNISINTPDNHLTKVLGVPMSLNQKLISQYWKDKLKKAENITNLWNKHYLSLKGKVLIWNSLIHSLFIHSSFVVQPHPQIFYELNNILRNFLWHQKSFHALSLDKLSLPLSVGGLNLLILERHLHALRFKDLIKTKDDFFLKLILKNWNNKPFYEQLIDIGKFRSRSTAVRPSNINYITPFWNNMIDSLIIFNQFTNLDFFFNSNTKDWNNKNFREFLNKNFYYNHSTNFIKNTYEVNFQESKVWKNLWKPRVKPKINETFYLFLHRSLGLPDRLKYTIHGCPNCKNNHVIISHQHLFEDCLVSSSSLFKNIPNLKLNQKVSFIYSGGILGKRNPIQHRLWFYAVWKNYLNNSRIFPSTSWFKNK
ncbi:MAG: reverse transcriptase domain-containing protein [Flavobacterium sp.]